MISYFDGMNRLCSLAKNIISSMEKHIVWTRLTLHAKMTGNLSQLRGIFYFCILK